MRDAVGHALKRQRFTELGSIGAKLRTQQLHRAVALRLESAEAEILTQRVIGDERVERSPFPNNLLARGGENLGQRSSFFIV